MTAMTFAIGGIAFWMPFYLVRRPGAPASATIIFGGVTCVAGLVATLAGGLAGDKLRARFPGSYFLVSGVAMIAGFPFMLLTLRAPFPLDLGLAVRDLLLPLLQHGPDEHDPRQRHAPIDPRGRVRAQHPPHPRFGDVLSPVVIGVVGDRYDMDRAFLLVSAMFVAAGILWLLGARHLQRDTALAPTRLAREPR